MLCGCVPVSVEPQECDSARHFKRDCVLHPSHDEASEMLGIAAQRDIRPDGVDRFSNPEPVTLLLLWKRLLAFVNDSSGKPVSSADVVGVRCRHPVEGVVKPDFSSGGGGHGAGGNSRRP